MLRVLIHFALLLTVSSVANAIGRTGNGVVDNDDGFEAKVSNSYPVSQDMGDGNLRLYRATSPIIGPESVIELRRVVNVFPEFVGKSRDEVALALTKNRWQQVPSPDPCVDIFVYRSSSGVGGLAVWGQQKGVLGTGIDSDMNSREINGLLSNLTIFPGACDWK